MDSKDQQSPTASMADMVVERLDDYKGETCRQQAAQSGG